MKNQKTALVTGAGARVGQAIAIELAHAGFEVAIHYNHSEAGALRTLEACHGKGWLVKADLNDIDALSQMIQTVKQRWDHLDILVNNASLFEGVPFEQITMAQWDQMMNVHARAPFLLSQQLLPLLKACQTQEKPNQSALVVHLCDIGAERPLSGYAHYSVSKAALMMLVKAMAVELAPAVRTLGISPGQVIWPENYSEALRDQLKQRIPMKDVGTPEDVARLLRFIALEGTYLNGNIIAVDGGLQCRY
jgi:pteridine reductase